MADMTRDDDSMTLNRRRLLTLGSAAALGLAGGAGLIGRVGAAAAQGGTPVPTKGRIAFGQPHRTADVYKPLIAGAKEEGAKRGYEILESFAEGQAAKQVAEINTWIAQEVDALVILPLDEKAMAPLVKKAKDAGSVFVTYSVSVPGEDGHILFDHPQGAALVGEAAGKWVNETLGGKAEVALLTAEFNENGRLRINGAEQKLLELAPNAKVVARQEAILAPEALKATQSILQAHPNVNVIICIADDGCLGAAQAFKATRRDPETMFIAGFDGSKQVMERIIAGEPIRATAALDLLAIGRSVAWVPANILEGGEPTSVNHPYQLVTVDTPDLAQKLIASYGG